MASALSGRVIPREIDVSQQPEVKLTLGGLTALEVQELRQALIKAGGDPTAVLSTSSEATLQGARKGEPMTMLAIVVLGQIALSGLVIYLAKGRTKIKKHERVRFTDAQGRTMEYDLEIEGATEEAIQASVMKQLAAFKIALPDVALLNAPGKAT
jgi:hypothetical protein